MSGFAPATIEDTGARDPEAPGHGDRRPRSPGSRDRRETTFNSLAAYLLRAMASGRFRCMAGIRFRSDAVRRLSPASSRRNSRAAQCECRDLRRHRTLLADVFRAGSESHRSQLLRRLQRCRQVAVVRSANVRPLRRVVLDIKSVSDLPGSQLNSDSFVCLFRHFCGPPRVNSPSGRPWWAAYRLHKVWTSRGRSDAKDSALSERAGMRLRSGVGSVRSQLCFPART
jgi:hypothetical protein